MNQFTKLLTIQGVNNNMDWDTLCHYCENKADYESMLQEIIVCKHCVKEYVKQEVLTELNR